MSAARPFDPDAARARLERARRRAEAAAAPGPDAVRRILAERARELARPPPAPGAEVVLEALELRIGAAPGGRGAERLALPTAVCREVARYTPPVELPGLAPWLRGVVLHRGELLPAVDLDRLLGGGPGAGAGRLVIAGRGRAEVALLAAAVDELLRLSAEALRPPPPDADPLVRALGPGALVVLDGEALLSDARLFHGAPRGG